MNKLEIAIMASSLFLNFTSVCAVCYAFYKFVNRPRVNLEQRVTDLEVNVKEVKDSLKQGNDRFREQTEFNEVFIRCMLSFVTFETNYCLNTGYTHNEDLLKLKELLESYLARR